jgi:hypothetical protein
MSAVLASIAVYDDSPGGHVIVFRTLASLLASSAVARHHDDDNSVADDYGAPGVPGII